MTRASGERPRLMIARDELGLATMTSKPASGTSTRCSTASCCWAWAGFDPIANSVAKIERYLSMLPSVWLAAGAAAFDDGRVPKAGSKYLVGTLQPSWIFHEYSSKGAFGRAIAVWRL